MNVDKEYIISYFQDIIHNCEDFFSKVFVSIIYFSIFVAITLFVKSDVVCNIHMKAYEEGKLEKVLQFCEESRIT